MAVKSPPKAPPTTRRSRPTISGPPHASPSRDGADAKDLVLVHGQDPQGNLRVLRKKSDRIELGALRPVQDGRSIDGELVKLTPRPEAPILFDSETLYAPPRRAPESADARPTEAPREPRLSADGPAQVASDAYRSSWNRIFGSGKRSGRKSPPN